MKGTGFSPYVDRTEILGLQALREGFSAHLAEELTSGAKARRILNDLRHD
jgi:hypothetical protein